MDVAVFCKYARSLHGAVFKDSGQAAPYTLPFKPGCAAQSTALRKARPPAKRPSTPCSHFAKCEPGRLVHAQQLARREAPCYVTAMKTRLWFASLWLACITQAGTFYQVSTLQALMEGRYDGVITVGELKQHGDFGLGTFHAVEGEMIMVHGTVYQALADGTVQVADNAVGVPFACVAHVAVDGTEPITDVELSALHARIDLRFPDDHVPLAIYATGTFSRVILRSVEAQQPPYPPLPEVIAEQILFERDEVNGELVGFRMPVFWDKVNAPGYHFHFISSDRTFGGHVLALNIDEADFKTQPLHRALMTLHPPP